MLQTMASGTKRNVTAQQSGISKSSLYVAMTFKSLRVDCLHRMLLGKLKTGKPHVKRSQEARRGSPQALLLHIRYGPQQENLSIPDLNRSRHTYLASPDCFTTPAGRRKMSYLAQQLTQ